MWYATYKNNGEAARATEMRGTNATFLTITATPNPYTVKVIAPMWMPKSVVRSLLKESGSIDKLSETLDGPDPVIVVLIRDYLVPSAKFSALIFDGKTLTVELHVAPSGREIHIKDFPPNITQEFIVRHLSYCGRIRSVVMPDIPRTYSINASSYLKELRDHPLYSDVSILVGTTSFPAHRAILAKSSEYFEALLAISATGAPGSAKSDVNLVMCDITSDAEVFGKLLDLIYGKEITIDSKTVDTLELAHKVFLRGIDWASVLSLIDYKDCGEALLTLIHRVYPDPYQMPPEVHRVVFKNVEEMEPVDD